MIALLGAALAADLRFEEALRRGVDSPSGRIAAAEAAAARAGARAEASWRNPTLTWEEEGDRRALEVSVPVGLAGLARSVAADPARDAIALRARAAEAASGAAAGAAWLDARRAADHAVAAARMDELAERLSAAAAAQVASGEWSEVAGILARADAARALDRALAWELEATRALGRVAVLTGAPVEGLGPWPEIPVPPEADTASFPAVLAADLEARAALATRLAARLALLPALTVATGYDWGEESGPTYGAAIAIPLFAPGASALRASSARADASVARAELSALDAKAALASVQTEHRVAERLAAAWAIDGLDSVLDATVRLYDAGELSLAEYLTQRDLAVTATQHGIDARWRLARARLAGWELTGALPVEDPP